MKKFTLFGSVLALLFAGDAFAQVKLSLDKTHYRREIDDLVVRYENGPGNNNDWIGMAHIGHLLDGTPSGYSVTFAYLDVPNSKRGTATIPAHNLSAPGAVTDGYYYVQYLLMDGYQSEGNKVYFYLSSDDVVPIGKAKTLTLIEAEPDVATFSFEADEIWGELISEVIVDGVPCAEDDYLVEDGELYLFKDITTGSHTMTVKAMNWEDSSYPATGNGINDTRIVPVSFDATNRFTVDNRMAKMKDLTVFALNGTTVYQTSIRANVENIDLNVLGKGIFMIQLKGAEGVQILKVVVR